MNGVNVMMMDLICKYVDAEQNNGSKALEYQLQGSAIICLPNLRVLLRQTITLSDYMIYQDKINQYVFLYLPFIYQCMICAVGQRRTT